MEEQKLLRIFMGKLKKIKVMLSKEIIEIGKKWSFDKETTTKLLLEVDQLTVEELSDLEYVEDRLNTHHSVLGFISELK